MMESTLSKLTRWQRAVCRAYLRRVLPESHEYHEARAARIAQRWPSTIVLIYIEPCPFCGEVYDKRLTLTHRCKTGEYAYR